MLRWEHQWGEQSKRNGQVSESFVDVQGRLSQHRAEIDAAWKVLESQVNYQVQETRRWSGEMNRLLEDRPKKQ